MNSINYDKCGRYFGYIFWMLIPRVAATMLENVTSPGVKIAGTILRIICEIAPAYFLWQLRSEDGRFRTVSVFSLGIAVCDVVRLALSGGESAGQSGQGLSSAFSLIGAVLSLLYIIYLYPLLSGIMDLIAMYKSSVACRDYDAYHKGV